MGMMRFKSEEDFKEFQKRTGIRETKPYRAPNQGGSQTLAQTGQTEPKAIAVSRGKYPSGQDKPKAPPGPSQIHIRMRQQIQTAGLPDPIEEYYHIKGRDMRLDFAWPDMKIGLEVQGMVHRIKGKWERDIEKHNLCIINGWKVLYVTGKMVRSGDSIVLVTEFLNSDMGTRLGTP